MTNQTCRHCRFVDIQRVRFTPDIALWCHRRSPTADAASASALCWPRVSDFDWCGEWEERTAKQREWDWVRRIPGAEDPKGTRPADTRTPSGG